MNDWIFKKRHSYKLLVTFDSFTPFLNWLFLICLQQLLLDSYHLLFILLGLRRLTHLNSAYWCCDVLSIFVLSKWQHVALPTRWHASVRTLFYCYLTFLDQRTNISRKVRAPRHVSASGVPKKFQNCHLYDTKQTWTKHHNTEISQSLNETELKEKDGILRRSCFFFVISTKPNRGSTCNILIGGFVWY